MEIENDDETSMVFFRTISYIIRTDPLSTYLLDIGVASPYQTM